MRRRELHLLSAAPRHRGIRRTARVLLWSFIWSLVGFALMYGPLNQGLSTVSVLVSVSLGLLMGALLYRGLVSRRSRRKWQLRFVWPARLLLLYILLIVAVQFYSTGAIPVIWRNYGYQFDRFVDAVAIHSPGLDQLPEDWKELHREYRSQAEQAASDEAFLRIVEEWLTHSMDPLPSGASTRLLPSQGNERDGIWNRIRGSSVYAAAVPAAEGSPVKADLLPSGIGYIRMTSFAEAANSVDQFDDALAGLGEASALILDLRQSSGQSRKSAERVAGRFLAEPFTYGTASFRHRLPHFGWVKEITYTADPRGELFSGTVVVLSGPRTSGAAEALVLALQGSGRATVIGEPTAGMLDVPILFHLPGGRAHLPVGHFRPTKSLASEEVGIQPDIYVASGAGEIPGNEDVVLKVAIDYLIQQL